MFHILPSPSFLHLLCNIYNEYFEKKNKRKVTKANLLLNYNLMPKKSMLSFLFEKNNHDYQHAIKRNYIYEIGLDSLSHKLIAEK